MKKIGIITVLLCLSYAGHAQIGMWLGGVGNFYSTSNKNGNGDQGVQNTMGAFGPTVGFMLGERPAVGINFLFTSNNTKQNDANNSETNMTGWMIEPFFRYYSGSPTNFKFFGDLKVGFGGGTTTMKEDGENDMQTTYSDFGVNVCPGIQYWFNDSWSIAATIGELGYNSTTNKDNGGNKTGTTDNFGLALDFSTIDFSFFWHF